MSRIGGGEPKIPVWPWGGPRSVREKLVDPAQLERKRRKKLGDPKRPALASAQLLEFMGPGRTSDELRLPPPPSRFGGNDAQEPTPFPDRAVTRQVAERDSEASRRSLNAALAHILVAPDKLERMRAVIHHERQMLTLLGKVQAETDEVIELMKQEHKATGSY